MSLVYQLDKILEQNRSQLKPLMRKDPLVIVSESLKFFQDNVVTPS